jgi:hypothetical protein
MSPRHAQPPSGRESQQNLIGAHREKQQRTQNATADWQPHGGGQRRSIDPAVRPPRSLNALLKG